MAKVVSGFPYPSSKSRPDHINGDESDSKAPLSDDDYSSSDVDNSSDEEDDEPGWQEEALKSGELFYVEENANDKVGGSGETDLAKSSPRTKTNKEIYRNAMPKPTPVYLKTVFISVHTAKTQREHASVKLLASMLGIIVLDSFTKRDKIVVDALVPGGSSLCSGQVEVGDVLRSVNGVSVTPTNIEAVLSKVAKPSSLRLVFEAVEKTPFPNVEDKLSPIKLDTSTHAEDRPCVVNLLTPHSSRQNKLFALTDFYAVFYLTLNVHSDTAAEFDDVLYSYPAIEAAVVPSKLAQIRGLFLTLSDLMKESFSTRALSATLVVGEETIHCSFYHVATEVFILCLPSSSYSLPQAHITASNAVRLLSIMFGELKRAFQPENKRRLDHMFHYMLYLNASSSFKPNSPRSSFHFGVSSLVLPTALQASANAALAELEASDFDLGTKAMNYSRRLYSVRGSCLFYDGYLAASHLSKDDLFDVHLFCFNHNLLALRQKNRIGLLVIWRELFRWSDRSPKKKGDFPESATRTFLLVVGLKRTLLGALLQLNGKLFPSTHTPRPDTVLVDSIKAILLNLESRHFFTSLDHCLSVPSSLQLVPAEAFLSHHSKSLLGSIKPPTGESRQSGSRFKLRLQSPLKFKGAASDSDDGRNTTPKKSASTGERGRFTSRTSRNLFRDKSLSSQDSADSRHQSPKVSSRAQTGHSATDLHESLSGLRVDDESEQLVLTAGSANSLFSFVKFDTLRGLLIEPVGTHIGDDVHREVVDNFRKQAVLLHQRLAVKNLDSDHCTEEGVLFQYQMTKDRSESKKKFLQYWVIGRKMNKPRPFEFYVCFHNSAPQSMVELAFKSATCL